MIVIIKEILVPDNYILKDQIWQNVAELEAALAHVVVNIYIYKLIEGHNGSYFFRTWW
jgi:hypothetical protein